MKYRRILERIKFSSIRHEEEFWRLEKRIKNDRKKTGIQLEMTQSNFIYNIISLINEGAMSFQDLEEYSDE